MNCIRGKYFDRSVWTTSPKEHVCVGKNRIHLLTKVYFWPSIPRVWWQLHVTCFAHVQFVFPHEPAEKETSGESSLHRDVKHCCRGTYSQYPPGGGFKLKRICMQWAALEECIHQRYWCGKLDRWGICRIGLGLSVDSHYLPKCNSGHFSTHEKWQIEMQTP